jgi:CBS domain-containing protein
MERDPLPTARSIMARPVVTLRPEMRLLEAAGILLQREISGAPVVDENGELVGLLSEYDCLRAVAGAEYDLDQRDVERTVADAMRTLEQGVHTIPPELDLFGIAHEFVNLRVRRLPVVEDGRLLGQVSRRDALRAAGELRREGRERKHSPDYPQGREPITDYPRRR